jgi:HEAT repeat protein
MALAVTLAAAKVILSTLGVALFLAKEGPGQLPLFYVLLALASVLLSAAFSGVVDRVPRITLGQVAFLGSLLAAASLHIPIALQLPGIYYALLASAHFYEIVLDIVFWVVVAAYLDVIELKRGTAPIYMALAAGGVAGGGLTSALAPFAPTEDLLLALPVLGLIAAAQFGLAKRRLQELPDPHRSEADASGPVENLRLLPRLVARYPLILLIAFNALLLTILYGLCEYLVFTVYVERFPDEAALTRFLALMFAGIQVLEFALLYVVTRPLLERAGPLARNLVFPLASLGCLIGLAVGQKLPAAIATHLNAEAISNAVFQPVNNVNYAALPLRFHGRVRTLADGIFYPSGLALAGVMLLSLQGRVALTQVTFIAIVFALVFILINVGVGVLFLPTLVRNLRSGIIHFADAPSGGVVPAGMPPEQVRDLLRSADPEVQALGLDLAQRLDRAPFLEELRRLAPSADRSTRRQLATLLGRAPAERLDPLLDELLESDDVPRQLIALQVKLARGDGLAEPHAERLVGSPSRSVAALAALVLRPPGPGTVLPGLSAEILPWCRDAEVAADLIDACAQARRTDLGDLLIAAIEAAPPEQQRQGLAVIPALVSADHTGAAALAIRLADHGDPRLRAEAVGALGAVADSPQALQALGHALGDRSRMVRQRAAAALAAKGDRAIPIAARQLDATDPGVVEAAVSTLGRIGSRRATQTLGALLAPLYRDGIRNLDWLGRLPRGPEHRAWLALELTLQDHNRRIVDMVLNVVAALGPPREITDLRLSLAAADRRTRANALEALLALPQRRLVQPILPLLEAAYASEAPVARQPEASRSDPVEILSAAAQATDPWVRCGAVHSANALAAAQRPSIPGRDRSAVAPPGMVATELDMDRVLLLKRVALFRSLPLDTLLAVSRVLERRQYLDRDTILEVGTSWDHFCIVESGAVDLFGSGGAVERLSAPAYFGELILADDRVAAPRAVAAGDCALLRLHRIVFRDLSLDYPDMLMELCKLLARRLRQQEGAAPGSLG